LNSINESHYLAISLSVRQPFRIVIAEWLQWLKLVRDLTEEAITGDENSSYLQFWETTLLCIQNCLRNVISERLSANN